MSGSVKERSTFCLGEGEDISLTSFHSLTLRTIALEPKTKARTRFRIERSVER